jgi:hypothetical protein
VNFFNLSAWAIRHQALVLFTIIALGLAGAWSYLNLGRNEDPTFTVKVMVVTAAWPGATAEEMQQQVADRIETKLQTLPWLEQVRTFTRPGFAAMQIVLKDATPPSEVQGLWYQVRKKIGDMRAELPQGVFGPFFNDEYSDVYVAVYMLTGEGAPDTLVDYAEDMRKSCSRSPMSTRSRYSASRAQDLHRYFTAMHARHPPQASSSRSRGRPRWCRPAPSIPRPIACRCASPARSTGSRRCGRCRSRPAASCFGWATSPRSAAGSRTRRAMWCASTRRRRSGSGSPWPRAPT